MSVPADLTARITAVDFDLAARTVGGEARGEPIAGRIAVAWAIRNRFEWPGGPYWWGESVASICNAPWQFSCWLHGDPNRALLLEMSAALPWYPGILDLVREVFAGTIPDPTQGASHYKCRGTPASWDKAVRDRCLMPVSIGHQDFFKIGPH